MNRRLLLPCVVALLMCSAPASGQTEGKDKIVVSHGGETYVVGFSDLRRATFEGDDIILKLADGTTATFVWNDVSAIKFDVVETSIDTPETVARQVRMYLRGGRIYVEGLPEERMPAAIYDISCRLCQRSQSAGTDGIDVSQLPRGIYIVKTKYASLKFKL